MLIGLTLFAELPHFTYPVGVTPKNPILGFKIIEAQNPAAPPIRCTIPLPAKSIYPNS